MSNAFLKITPHRSGISLYIMALLASILRAGDMREPARNRGEWSRGPARKRSAKQRNKSWAKGR